MKNWKKLFIIVCNIVVLILSLFAIRLALFDDTDNSVKDSLYQKESIVSNDIYVIGIDEQTLNNYGKFDTFNREKLAELIELLNSGDNAPSVIGVDISIFGEDDETIDNELIDVCSKYDNIVFCSSLTMANVAGEGQRVVLYEEPFDGLKAVCNRIGFSNLVFDNDGRIRHGLLYEESDGTYYSSFDEVIFETYCEKNGLSSEILDKLKEEYYIVYSGKPHAYFGSTSAGSSLYRVLEGEYPLEAFKGKIVLIGAYASGMQDNYYTSIDSKNQMYGVEIHANIINQLVKGEYKTEVSAYIPTAILGVLSLVVALLLSDRKSLVVEGLFIPVYILIAYFLYTKADLVLSILYPVLFEAVLLLACFVYDLAVSKYEKKKIIDNYSRYISPELAKTVAEKGESSLKLGGEKKQIAVLFVDIRGFTSLSEKLDPEKVVDFLNQYFIVTTSAILDNEGMIDKFVGDCTMGLWNALLPTDDYKNKAVLAGLQMIKSTNQFNDSLPDDLKGKVAFGVGVHCGEAVVGNIGSSTRLDFTAIGDTVNTTSRIESKAGRNQLLISQDLYEEVKNNFIIEDAGYITVKGKEEPLHVYEVIDKKD